MRLIFPLSVQLLRLLWFVAAGFCVHLHHHCQQCGWVASASTATAFLHHPLQVAQSRVALTRSKSHILTWRNSRDSVEGEDGTLASSSSFREADLGEAAAATTTIQADNKMARLGRRLIPPQVLEELSSPDIQFPYSCQLLPNYDVPQKSLFWKRKSSSSTEKMQGKGKPQQQQNQEPVIMSVRLLQSDDIETVTDMCCQEYGVGNVALDLSKTATKALKAADCKALNRLVQDLVDDFLLRLHVDWTMRLKVVAADLLPHVSLAQQQHENGSRSINNNNNTVVTQPPPQDHAVLLVTLADGGAKHNHHHDSSNEETVVGVVEVSRQPPIPERNPPAFPIPLLIKQLYCWWWSVSQHRKQQQQQQQQQNDMGTFPSSTTGSKASSTSKMTTMMQPEGWITNVLVAPEFRSQGWSKVLVHACEGVARSWNVPAIHLHCDADGISGRVAQQLYTSMGYQDECDDDEYEWLRLAAQQAAASPSSSSSSTSTTDATSLSDTTEPVMCSSSVYVIEGVPLLYLKKDLTLSA